MLGRLGLRSGAAIAVVWVWWAVTDAGVDGPLYDTHVGADVASRLGATCGEPSPCSVSALLSREAGWRADLVYVQAMCMEASRKVLLGEAVVGGLFCMMDGAVRLTRRGLVLLGRVLWCAARWGCCERLQHVLPRVVYGMCLAYMLRVSTSALLRPPRKARPLTQHLSE